VALWVTEDGRISVDPIGLLVEDPPSVPPATVTAVDDLLVAVGRLRQDSRGVSSNPLISNGCTTASAPRCSVYLQTEAQHVGADATLPQGVGQGGADEPAQRPGAEVLCVGYLARAEVLQRRGHRERERRGQADPDHEPSRRHRVTAQAVECGGVLSAASPARPLTSRTRGWEGCLR